MEKFKSTCKKIGAGFLFVLSAPFVMVAAVVCFISWGLLTLGDKLL